MATTVADVMVATLKASGVRRVWGIPGDSINGLFDANRSRVPVVAIAAHIPREEIGGGYFQETHPDRLFVE